MPVVARAEPYLLPFVTSPKWPKDPRATRGIPLSRRVAVGRREGTKQSDPELVFPSALDPTRNLSKSYNIRMFKDTCDQAKIRGLTIYKLRRTFGHLSVKRPDGGIVGVVLR